MPWPTPDVVTESIAKDSGRSEATREMIVCKSQAELEKMHRAGLVIWEVLNDLRGMRPGVSTKDLDEIARRSAPRNRGSPGVQAVTGAIPATLCTSVNPEMVHGIPSESRELKEGDIISLDFGVECEGYYGDAAVTVPVGEITPGVEEAPASDARIAGSGD